MRKETVLVVDDQPEVIRSIERLLKPDWNVRTAPGGSEALEWLKAGDPAVILCDQRMPKMTGVEFLERSLELRPDAVRILITAYADLDATIDAVNRGKIYAYAAKPWEPDELASLVRRAAERFQLLRENRRLTAELAEANERLKEENLQLRRTTAESVRFENLVGHGPEMLEVFKLVSKVLDAPTTVLLLGETGTGKELLARAIHYNGPRKDGPFVVQNCGALPDTLLESELFGHVKGAFTGAVKDKKGLFELADGGTIFLDEIADTSPALQTRLLRVLQDGELRPVGGTRTLKTNVRVIAATNKDLTAELKAGRFREDLYYRLNVFPVRLHPLRERREDLADLIAHFVRKCSKKLGRSVKSVSPAAERLLHAAEWPGNVRELENEIERAVTLAGDESVIEPRHLSPRFLRTGGDAPETGTLRESVETLEKKMISAALIRSGSNVSRAAAELGLSRLGLYKKMERYGIKTSS
jgi:two-component system, NtrC family, response regulator HupR/HoxA